MLSCAAAAAAAATSWLFSSLLWFVVAHRACGVFIVVVRVGVLLLQLQL